MTFLKNASNLVRLDLDRNSIQSEEFNFLLVALCESPVKKLRCCGCNIDSIQIDSNRYPAKLEALFLCDNEITEDGCRGIATLLQMPDCALEHSSTLFYQCPTEQYIFESFKIYPVRRGYRRMEK